MHRPHVIEFRGSDPTPNSLLVRGRPDPRGAQTVAELLAAARANLAAGKAITTRTKEPVCRCCGGHGVVRYVEGDPVPVRAVAAGDGEFVRVGEKCPECGGGS